MKYEKLGNSLGADFGFECLRTDSYEDSRYFRSV